MVAGGGLSDTKKLSDKALAVDGRWEIVGKAGG